MDGFISALRTAWQFVGEAFGYLLAHIELGSVVVGTLAAISITQVVKMAVIQWAPKNGGRGLWYCVQFVIGIGVTWLNWRTPLGLSWGLAVGGFIAPSLYTIGTRLLYRYFPDAEAMISATPRA